jgi:hypothetical protein
LVLFLPSVEVPSANGSALEVDIRSASDSLPGTDSLVLQNQVVEDMAETVLSPPERHSPTKAAWRAAVLPGWGQIYNRKYWKLPLVYGGLGGLGYWVGINAVEHRQYRRSYIAKTDEDAGFADPFPGLPESSVLSAREFYRRQLDASILLTVAFYGLQIVDAVVDAHLFEFDVSDDLSLQASPWLPMGAPAIAPAPPGLSTGMQGLDRGAPGVAAAGLPGSPWGGAAQAWGLPSPQAAGLQLTFRFR